MSKQRQQTNSQTNYSQATSLPGMTPEQAALNQRLMGIGDQQSAILNQLFTQAGQPQAPSAGISQLNPQDMGVLNQAFQGAENNLMRQAGILRDQLGGATGLRGFSSPIATSVSREILPQLALLNSQRAQQQLGLGLNIRDFNENNRRYNQGWQLGLTQATPQNYNNLANYWASLQFAQPRVTGNQNSASSSSQTPSVMNSIGQGMNLFQQGAGIIGGGLAGFNTGGLTGLLQGVGPKAAGAAAV